MSRATDIAAQIGTYMQETLRSRLLSQGHIASTSLYESIRSYVDERANGMEISVSGNFYAKFVNSGRRVGVKGVPIDALVDWIRIKKFDLRGKRVTSVAFAMQRSIKIKGIKPSKFIDLSAEEFAKSKRLESDVDRIINEYVEGLFQPDKIK